MWNLIKTPFKVWTNYPWNLRNLRSSTSTAKRCSLKPHPFGLNAVSSHNQMKPKKERKCKRKSIWNCNKIYCSWLCFQPSLLWFFLYLHNSPLITFRKSLIHFLNHRHLREVPCQSAWQRYLHPHKQIRVHVPPIIA